MNIVLVEDNEILREAMMDYLARPAWSIHWVDCGESLNDWLLTHSPDVVILDVNLPYEDGYSIAQRLRDSHQLIGIIMLSARVRHSDRTEGYRSGADVYLTKPTNPEELIAVIENLGRRIQPQSGPVYVLDKASGEIVDPWGKRCALTLNELNLLVLLIMAPERLAHKDYLSESLTTRSDKPMTMDALAVLISRLRQKCKVTLSVDQLVTAHRGVGYRLHVPMRLGSSTVC